jgi:mRNA-degrading endonuclease toxin of MazEF toxin-antitoxin module
VPDDFPLRGDIYYVGFPDPVGSHYAVVVTADAINRNSDTVLVATITTKGIDKIYPHEFKVPTGLLPKPSKVKCHSIIMLEKEELKNYIGTIDKKDMQGLDVALLRTLDLWIS